MVCVQDNRLPAGCGVYPTVRAPTSELLRWSAENLEWWNPSWLLSERFWMLVVTYCCIGSWVSIRVELEEFLGGGRD